MGDEDDEGIEDNAEIDRQRQSWAVRFSLTMHALNPGVQVGFQC